jgi:hypothetical protein
MAIFELRSYRNMKGFFLVNSFIENKYENEDNYRKKKQARKRNYINISEKAKNMGFQY